MLFRLMENMGHLAPYEVPYRINHTHFVIFVPNTRWRMDRITEFSFNHLDELHKFEEFNGFSPQRGHS